LFKLYKLSFYSFFFIRVFKSIFKGLFKVTIFLKDLLNVIILTIYLILKIVFKNRFKLSKGIIFKVISGKNNLIIISYKLSLIILKVSTVLSKEFLKGFFIFFI
jgi:hypothetical protein